MDGQKQKAVGWSAVVVGAVIDVINYFPTSKSVVDGLKASGGTGAAVADVLLSPVFGLVVIAIGLALLYQSRKGGGSLGERAASSAPVVSGSGSAVASGSGSSANVNANTNAPTFNNTFAPQVTVHAGPMPDQPHLVFADDKQFQLTQYVPILILGSGAPRPISFQSYVCEAWFRNEPLAGTPSAKALNAYIVARQLGQQVHSDAAHGEWAVANAPNNGAFSETKSTWPELLPNGDLAKLVIAHKNTADADGYVWLDAAKQYPGRKHPSYVLMPGDYEIEVRIRGIGIDQTFLFALVNPGSGSDLVMTGPI